MALNLQLWSFCQSTASRFSYSQILNLKGCKGSATASFCGSLYELLCLYRCRCVLYIHMHKHMLTHRHFRIFRWTSFHRYQGDPGTWTPKVVACRCLLGQLCRNGTRRMSWPLQDHSRETGHFDYQYSGSDYTQKNFHVILTAILIWV